MSSYLRLVFFLLFKLAVGSLRFVTTPLLLIASQWILEFFFNHSPCTISPAIPNSEALKVRHRLFMVAEETMAGIMVAEETMAGIERSATEEGRKKARKTLHRL